jgi:hypothetical protein
MLKIGLLTVGGLTYGEVVVEDVKGVAFILLVKFLFIFWLVSNNSSNFCKIRLKVKLLLFNCLRNNSKNKIFERKCEGCRTSGFWEMVLAKIVLSSFKLSVFFC